MGGEKGNQSRESLISAQHSTAIPAGQEDPYEQTAVVPRIIVKPRIEQSDEYGRKRGVEREREVEKYIHL